MPARSMVENCLVKRIRSRLDPPQPPPNPSQAGEVEKGMGREHLDRGEAPAKQQLAGFLNRVGVDHAGDRPAVAGDRVVLEGTHGESGCLGDSRLVWCGGAV